MARRKRETPTETAQRLRDLVEARFPGVVVHPEPPAPCPEPGSALPCNHDHNHPEGPS